VGGGGVAGRTRLRIEKKVINQWADERD
jgi:hypothetical protein